MLSVLRIVAALLFLEHGTAEAARLPARLDDADGPDLMSMIWFAGMIELVPGALIAVGLFTRAAAFIAAGEMAFAYFMGHAPRRLLPGQQCAATPRSSIASSSSTSSAPVPGPWSLDADAQTGRGPESDGERQPWDATQRLDFRRISCYITGHRSGCLRIRTR